MLEKVLGNYRPDEEIKTLRRDLRVSNRDIASSVCMVPATLASKICGSNRWMPGERERVMAYLEEVRRGVSAPEDHH